MKKYIPLLIITSLLLSGCSIGFNNEENNSFKKKQECNNMFVKIENYLKDTGYTSWKLNSIFYSPKMDSCLYISETESTINTNWKHILISDAFTKEPIITSQCEDPKNNPFECILDLEKLDTKIKELKWE